MSAEGEVVCDVLVIGSGAGGLAAAVTARHHRLDVIVAEKAPVSGGTTARSGGWVWIPCHPLQASIGVVGSRPKSLGSALYTARLLGGLAVDLPLHGRSVRLTNGNALAGRLLKSAADLNVDLWASAPARELVVEDGAVRGAVVEGGVAGRAAGVLQAREGQQSPQPPPALGAFAPNRPAGYFFGILSPMFFESMRTCLMNTCCLYFSPLR